MSWLGRNDVCVRLDYDVIIMKTLNRDLSKNCDIILGEGARWASKRARYSTNHNRKSIGVCNVLS